jgi:hypothetical protein
MVSEPRIKPGSSCVISTAPRQCSKLVYVLFVAFYFVDCFCSKRAFLSLQGGDLTVDINLTKTADLERSDVGTYTKEFHKTHLGLF